MNNSIEQGLSQTQLRDTGPLVNPQVLDTNLVNINHDPDLFHAAVQSLRADKDTGPLENSNITHIKKDGERPLYSKVQTPDELHVIAKHGIYDVVEQMRDENGKYRGIDAPEMRSIREAVWNLTQTEGVSAILPFHEEQGSVGGNMATAREWIGQNRVYGISTGKDKQAVAEARENGGYVFEQEEIFNAVEFNWDLLRETAGIDLENYGSNKPLAGSKGITLLAGTILATALAEAGEINQQQIMVWHDTDIINSKEYSAIPLALLPYTQENPEIAEVYMSLIARNGVGRNNEAVTMVINRLANSKRDPLVRQFGNMLRSTVWPLTGERAMRLDRLRNMPTASGMGLETLTNAYVAGICATERRGHIANVLDPMPKKEKGESKPVREFTVVNTAANMLWDIGDHVRDTQKFPNQWSIADIKEYNMTYGGKSLDLVLQADELGPQEAVTIKSDYIIPSINMLIALNIVKIPQPIYNAEKGQEEYV